MSKDDAKVIGYQTDVTGTTYGVWGEVDSADGYGLYTPDGAKIDGVLDTTSYWQVNIDGSSNVFVGDDAGSGEAGNVVLGHSSNGDALSVSPLLSGATIAGGGYDDGDTADQNLVLDNFGTVGGGRDNQAGSDDIGPTTAEHATVGGGFENKASDFSATVGGGRDNTASGSQSTVCGGIDNLASGSESTIAGGDRNNASGDNSTVGGGFNNTATAQNATIPGGYENEASSDDSFAAGRQAKARADGAFVWGDSSSNTVESTTTDEVVFQAGGGVTMWSTSDFNAGVELNAGAGTWSSLSARASKHDVTTADGEHALAGVESLTISTWEYDAQEGVTHMGPMAEDFHETFGLGADEERISTVDADGVALAAIQGLAERLEQKEERIEDLEAETDRIDDLERENERLRERLAALEERITDD